MNAVTGWAGLRPSEVVALEVPDLISSTSDWGSIRVDKAQVEQSVRLATDGDQELGLSNSENSKRTVPILLELLAILREWIDDEGIEMGRLFGEGVGSSHCPESVKLACEKPGVRSISPYDLRRAYSSHPFGRWRTSREHRATHWQDGEDLGGPLHQACYWEK